MTAATTSDGAVAYEYDNVAVGGAYAKGRLTTLTDPSGNTTFTYDALGRVTSKTQTVNANPTSKAFRIDYAYGPGRPAGLTYPSGRVVAYGFNAGGQVTSITVDGVTVLASAEYLPFGAVQKWVWANGQVYERAYDLDGRVDTLTTGPATGTYGDLSQVFGYDSLNRLISAQLAAGQSQGFAYDANGNRTSATINGAATTYTYPTTSHRLTSLSGATTRSFTYDAAGNTASSAGITYVYDGRGRMKQAGSTTYLVNGLGQRVKKASGAAETYFAYDEAGHLIGEYDGSGAPIEETVWLADIPVAVLRPNATNFDVFYVWPDHLGTPRQITDAANQSRWEWPNNDPFGNNLPNENPAGLGTFTYNLRFLGQYFDSETGKHYNYFRDYDPAIGRYLKSDPIGLDGGLNTYAYVGGNPLLYMDTTGLAIACTKKLMLVTAYNDKGPGKDWSYYKPKAPGGKPGSVGPGTIAMANSKPTPYQFGCHMKVLGKNNGIDYEGDVHDTGAGWDSRHHNVAPDEWIDIWKPGQSAIQWGKQWRMVEICCETTCP